MNEMRKTCLITGATNGIGRAAASRLAELGHRIVLVGRNEERGTETVAELRKRSENDDVSFMRADLSSVAETRDLAHRFLSRHDRLDVLLNNAGAIFKQREVTPEGFERTFALDHLAYFVLTVELLDLLRESAPSRIVNVSSGAHKGGKIRFDDIHLKRSYSAFGAYCQAKLANILFTNELARRLDGSGVTVNSMHPGFIWSGFGRNNGRSAAVLLGLLRPFARSPEAGADTLVHLAISPEVEEVSGRYFFKRHPARISEAAASEGAARRLWELSEEMVESVRSRPLKAEHSE